MQTAVLPDLAEAERGRPQFDELLALVGTQLADADVATLERADDFAATAHEGQFRKSGEPYILHPIATARALVEIQFIDVETLSAALLHDVIEDTGRTVEDLEQEFGTKVARLVDGVTKLGMTASKVTQTEETTAARLERDKAAQAENLRKMVLAMAEVQSVRRNEKLATMYVVDVSQSIPQEYRSSILQFVSEDAKKRDARRGDLAGETM